MGEHLQWKYETSNIQILGRLLASMSQIEYLVSYIIYFNLSYALFQVLTAFFFNYSWI